MTTLMNLPLVSNLVGTMVMPCCLASEKRANWRLLTNNFRAEVSMLRALA